MIPVCCKYWHLKRGKVLCYSSQYFQWSLNTMDIPTITHLKNKWTSSTLIVGRCSLLLFLHALIVLFLLSNRILGFPGSSDGKETACSAGDLGSIPGVGRSPGEGNGNPLQYSGLENPTDRGAWRATVPGVAKSWAQLCNQHFYTSTNKSEQVSTGTTLFM